MVLYRLAVATDHTDMVTTAAPVARVRAPIDPLLIASMTAVFVIWGSTYLAARIAVREIPPFTTACLRFVTAGAVMLLVALRRGAKLPPLRDWLRVAPAGFLLFVCGNGFVVTAETTVASSGAAIVCAMMPLWMGVLGAVSGIRPTRREWLSLVVGFVGVVVLVGGPSLAGDRIDVVLLLLSPPSWALGSLLARRVKDVGGEHAGLVGPALQMLVGGAMLALVAAVRGEHIPAGVSAHAWLSVAYLAVFGSLVGFTAYSWLLRHARPVVATSYAYVNPVIAVIIGAALYGEPIGPSTIVANVLIGGAVMLALRK